MELPEWAQGTPVVEQGSSYQGVRITEQNRASTFVTTKLGLNIIKELRVRKSLEGKKAVLVALLGDAGHSFAVYEESEG